MSGSGRESSVEYATTPVSEIAGMVTELRENFYATLPTSLEYRLSQLRQVLKMLKENKKEIESTFTSIFGGFGDKHYVCRVYLVECDVIHMINNLSSYMSQSEKWAQPLPVNLMWSSRTKPHPKGVVCVIGAWNYPLSLVLRPLIGAIAAGNACVVKPSEVSDGMARLLLRLVPRYLDPKMVRVVCGGVPETARLLEQRFDHICFTGSSFIGKIVMAAAAKHLTPVCLELGGKNPVIVDDRADLETSLKRIAFARWWFNSGQVCVCPEYLLVSEDRVQECVALLRRFLKEFFVEEGRALKDSAHYGKIVNARHWRRLDKVRRHYLEQARDKILVGEGAEHKGDEAAFGASSEKDRFMAPMVVGLKEEEFETELIMQEEVFGPFLTIVAMKGGSKEWRARAASMIQRSAGGGTGCGGQPLVCYVFSPDKEFIEFFDARVAAGSITANDCIMQLSLKEVPFGGTGQSGMGHYGGKHSFDLFTHYKPLSTRAHGLEFLNKDRYPPGDLKGLVKMVDRVKPKLGGSMMSSVFKYGVVLCAAMVLGYYLSNNMGATGVQLRGDTA